MFTKKGACKECLYGGVTRLCSPASAHGRLTSHSIFQHRHILMAATVSRECLLPISGLFGPQNLDQPPSILFPSKLKSERLALNGRCTASLSLTECASRGLHPTC